MKKMIVIIATITVLLFTGCDGAHLTETDQQETSRLYVIDNSMSYRIYVDKETKVMYLRTKQGSGEALCVMVDADGKPLMWRGEEHG